MCYRILDYFRKIEPSFFFSSPQYIGNQGVINEPLVINTTPEGYSISHKNSLKNLKYFVEQYFGMESIKKVNKR